MNTQSPTSNEIAITSEDNSVHLIHCLNSNNIYELIRIEFNQHGQTRVYYVGQSIGVSNAIVFCCDDMEGVPDDSMRYILKLSNGDKYGLNSSKVNFIHNNRRFFTDIYEFSGRTKFSYDLEYTHNGKTVKFLANHSHGIDISITERVYKTLPAFIESYDMKRYLFNERRSRLSIDSIDSMINTDGLDYVVNKFYWCPKEDILIVLMQFLLGAYKVMASSGFYYFDLKADNIGVTVDGALLLIDIDSLRERREADENIVYTVPTRGTIPGSHNYWRVQMLSIVWTVVSCMFAGDYRRLCSFNIETICYYDNNESLLNAVLNFINPMYEERKDKPYNEQCYDYKFILILYAFCLITDEIMIQRTHADRKFANINDFDFMSKLISNNRDLYREFNSPLEDYKRLISRLIWTIYIIVLPYYTIEEKTTLICDSLWTNNDFEKYENFNLREPNFYTYDGSEQSIGELFVDMAEKYIYSFMCKADSFKTRSILTFLQSLTMPNNSWSYTTIV